jgi:nucleoid DNA-binding protein
LTLGIPTVIKLTACKPVGFGGLRGAMTKADLIDAIAKRHSLPRPNAEEFLNGILDDVIGALKSGDKVNISGFGTFSVSQRKGRTGRNPKTGEAIQIAPSRAAKFKPGKILKESLS